MNIDQISNDEEQNNNILSNDFFHQENDNQLPAILSVSSAERIEERPD